MYNPDTILDAATVESVVAQTVDELTPRNVFHFNSPRRTVVGEWAILKIGKLLHQQQVKHVFAVVDQTVHELGLLNSTLRCLKRANIGCTVFSGVAREPTTDVVEQALTILRRCEADFVLGFGGGSAMDAAKAVAVIKSCHCSLDDLTDPDFDGRRTIGLGAVPTTAGTGSEVTDISVIIHADEHRKYVAKQLDLMPDLAIIDPGLMLGLPPKVTAATGIDALTHAIEAYVSSSANPLTRALATSAITGIHNELPTAVGNGNCMPARLGMAVAAYKAGLAFCNAGLGLVHAISHQVGALYGIPHGVANGILLPYVMEFNALVCRSQFASIAHAMGVARECMDEREQCEASIAAIRRLLSDIGLPDSLADYNARLEDFSDLADEALQDICVKSNPRNVTKADVIQLLERATR